MLLRRQIQTAAKVRFEFNEQQTARSISTTSGRRNTATSLIPRDIINTDGFFSWLLSKKSSSAGTLPSLVEPLSGVKLPPPLPDHPQNISTEITRLENGLVIASENTTGSTATVGLYIDSGSIYEKSSNSGATHLLERMAFKSTVNRSHLRLIREAEAIGGNLTALATREQMSYTADVIKTYLPEAVELLSDSVRNPVFHEWEVNEQLRLLENEHEELSKNPQNLLMEALHTCGYTGGLAMPLLTSHHLLQKLSPRTLKDFVSENYTASRMVLSASGVDHAQLVSLARPLFEDMPLVKIREPAESTYIGGDWRTSAECDKCHVAIAFEVPGGWRNKRDSVAASVLQLLLGGGNSFSSGGPGKGVHSRLYTRVLNNYKKVENFTAFSNLYNNSGLFGIQAASVPEFSSELVELMTEELAAVASPGELSDIEVERAKNATITLVSMNLESKVVVSEDIGRQILTYGCRKPAEEFISSVRRLRKEDIREVAAKIISTPLTMAAWGDVNGLPSYEDVADGFD